MGTLLKVRGAGSFVAWLEVGGNFRNSLSLSLPT